MTQISDNDRTLIGFLQKDGAKSVAELSDWMNVTETAIRQRLTRLVAQSLVTRTEVKVSRGRPVHKYSVTKEGRASNGQNFLDLAAVVWEEVKAIDDRQTRSQVMKGIAKRLASKYKDEINRINSIGDSASALDRAEAIAQFFEGRGIPVTVSQKRESELPEAAASRADYQTADHQTADHQTAEIKNEGSNDEPNDGSDTFPILQLHGCPYPGLSDGDDLICEMEQNMFSELAGCAVELSRCDRKSESECCSFQLEAHSAEQVHQE